VIDVPPSAARVKSRRAERSPIRSALDRFGGVGVQWDGIHDRDRSASPHPNRLELPTITRGPIAMTGTGDVPTLAFPRKAFWGAETVDVPVATAGDTLLPKLAWFRFGRRVSDQQSNDIRGIAEIQRVRLDLDCLRCRAGHLKPKTCSTAPSPSPVRVGSATFKNLPW